MIHPEQAVLTMHDVEYRCLLFEYFSVQMAEGLPTAGRVPHRRFSAMVSALHWIDTRWYIERRMLTA